MEGLLETGFADVILVNDGSTPETLPYFQELNRLPQDTLLTLPTALTFGKSSLPTAREWAERGFKSMSAKQTACYPWPDSPSPAERWRWALARRPARRR